MRKISELKTEEVIEAWEKVNNESLSPDNSLFRQLNQSGGDE
jgi:hypothetical protein